MPVTMLASKTGYHRCHGENRMSHCSFITNPMLDPSLWMKNPLRRDTLAEPGWSVGIRLGASGLDALRPYPELERSPRSQGQSRTPKALRVFPVERGNPDSTVPTRVDF